MKEFAEVRLAEWHYVLFFLTHFPRIEQIWLSKEISTHPITFTAFLASSQVFATSMSFNFFTGKISIILMYVGLDRFNLFFFSFEVLT